MTKLYVSFTLWVVVCLTVLACCLNVERNRVQRYITASYRHKLASETQPTNAALQLAVDKEQRDVREYYDAIDADDQKRFETAKKQLADDSNTVEEMLK